MHPLGFLRPAKAPEPIYCCSSAEPIMSPGAYKVHNDPNRDLHDSIFSSFMNFVIRRQRQATLLQLALSHVEESAATDDDLTISALEFVARTTSTTSPALSVDSLSHADQLDYLLDPEVPQNYIGAAGPTPSSAQSGASSFQTHSSTIPVTSTTQTPAAAQPVANAVPQTPTFSNDVFSASPENSNRFIPAYSASPTYDFGPASVASEGAVIPSLSTNFAGAHQSFRPVSPPETLTRQTSPSCNVSNLPTQTSQQPYARGYTTPTKVAASVRLSVTAQPFVPGLVRGVMTPGLASAFHQTRSSNKTTLPTLYEGLRSSGTLKGDTTAIQHAIGQKSGISDLQSQGGPQATNENSQALLGLLVQHTQPKPSTSSMSFLESDTHLTNTSQYYGKTEHASYHAGMGSVTDTHQDVHLTTPPQNSAPTNFANSMRFLEEQTQPLTSPYETAPCSDLQPQTNTWLPKFTLPNAIPHDNHSLRRTNQRLPVELSSGSYQHVSQSDRSPTSVSSSSRQNAIVSAPSYSPASMLESSSQAAVIPYNPTQSHAPYRSSSASSWRSQPFVSNSASSSQRPKPRSSNSFSSVSTQSRTVASSSRQSQQHQTPLPLVVFDMEEARTNPLTESTSYVIHLTSRLDYGPVISHRYFICPQDLNDDWIELTLFQWWCRGESFKMKAEKWDVKCGKHNKFFRMTLRPNLMMRDDLLPSFGASKLSQLE